MLKSRILERYLVCFRVGNRLVLVEGGQQKATRSQAQDLKSEWVGTSVSIGRFESEIEKISLLGLEDHPLVSETFPLELNRASARMTDGCSASDDAMVEGRG